MKGGGSNSTLNKTIMRINGRQNRNKSIETITHDQVSNETLTLMPSQILFFFICPSPSFLLLFALLILSLKYQTLFRF